MFPPPHPGGCTGTHCRGWPYHWPERPPPAHPGSASIPDCHGLSLACVDRPHRKYARRPTHRFGISAKPCPDNNSGWLPAEARPETSLCPFHPGGAASQAGRSAASLLPCFSPMQWSWYWSPALSVCSASEEMTPQNAAAASQRLPHPVRLAAGPAHSGLSNQVPLLLLPMTVMTMMTIYIPRG